MLEFGMECPVMDVERFKEAANNFRLQMEAITVNIELALISSGLVEHIGAAIPKIREDLMILMSSTTSPITVSAIQNSPQTVLLSINCAKENQGCQYQFLCGMPF